METTALTLLILLVAILYSSVGHGGASGYLAVLSLFAFPAKEASTTALVLNVIVSGIAFCNFTGAGFLNRKTALPFLLGSVPAAFLGGYFPIHQAVFDGLLACAFVAAAFRMLLPLNETPVDKLKSPKSLILSMIGASIGALSGVVGIGGGVILSPVLLFFRWATIKQTAAIAALFILANSLAGLVGRLVSGQLLLGNLTPMIAVAILGGWLGSSNAAKRFAPVQIKYLLAIVLLIAAIRGVTRIIQ
ncbi:MAG: sulfite exporter TauE/SafE family protein [bacterium]|nr:sulfite exporter TauE/SafE family protein [bacterium]